MPEGVPIYTDMTVKNCKIYGRDQKVDRKTRKRTSRKNNRRNRTKRCKKKN